MKLRSYKKCWSGIVVGVSKVTLSCILFAFFAHINTLAQSSTELSTYFNKIRAHENASVEPLIKSLRNDPKAFSEIRPYTQDSLTEVRAAAFSLVAQLGQQSSTSTTRKEAVALTLLGWKDKDAGINSLVGSELSRFVRSDFNNASKDSLRRLVRKMPPHYGKLVKLCGYLTMTDLLSTFRSQLQSGAIADNDDKWACWLALCRLGDQTAMSYVMARVRKPGVNSDVVNNVLPDLIYTRQPTAIAYLVEIVHSDSYRCELSNPRTTGQTLCAYKVMEYLALIVEDFPVKLDTAGNIESKDYPKALAQTREWFKNNKTYKIKSDKF